MNGIDEAIDNIETTEKYLRSIGESWYADILSDAVELLNEQEPVVPERRFIRPDLHFDTYRCQSCDFMHLRYGQQFCGGCGRKVKWDD